MKIEKLDEVNDVNFNAVDMKRCVRVMTAKINQLIDVINMMQEEPYTDDLDEDDDKDKPILLEEKDLSKAKKKNKLLKG